MFDLEAIGSSARKGARLGAGFGKQQRLANEAAFAGVLKSGQRKFSAHFALYWASPWALPGDSGASASGGVARLGVIVAKKLARSSVERNRIKRLMREAFRQHAQASSGWDMVLRLNRPAAQFAGNLLLTELAELLRRAPPLPDPVVQG